MSDLGAARLRTLREGDDRHVRDNGPQTTRRPCAEEATTTKQVAVSGSADQAGCWCCGQQYPNGLVVRLGNHPEVGVCLRCAHFLHQQARSREDVLRPSIASRLRDGLRSGRRVVMQRGWHQKPVIGPGFRWLGRHLP